MHLTPFPCPAPKLATVFYSHSMTSKHVHWELMPLCSLKKRKFSLS